MENKETIVLIKEIVQFFKGYNDKPIINKIKTLEDVKRYLKTEEELLKHELTKGFK